MAQQVKALVTKHDDLTSCPGHTWWRETADLQLSSHCCRCTMSTHRHHKEEEEERISTYRELTRKADGIEAFFRKKEGDRN